MIQLETALDYLLVVRIGEKWTMELGNGAGETYDAVDFVVSRQFGYVADAIEKWNGCFVHGLELGGGILNIVC